jgi:hypothetical protein
VLQHGGSPDRFIARHPAFDRYVLGFVRENQQVTQAYHGSDWYAGAHYSGPRSFESPKELEGLAGHYYNDSPWYGDTRVVLRRGQLFLDGTAPLLARGDGKFGVGDPEGPDFIGFESIVNGRAMQLNYSGIIFRRMFTP